MDKTRGETNIKRLEENVKLNRTRVIESFTFVTKNKRHNKKY